MKPESTAPLGVLVIAVSSIRTLHAARKTPDGWRDQFGNVMSAPLGWVELPPETMSKPQEAPHASDSH